MSGMTLSTTRRRQVRGIFPRAQIRAAAGFSSRSRISELRLIINRDRSHLVLWKPCMCQVGLRPVCSTLRPGSAVGPGEADEHPFHLISVRSDDASACNTPADAISLSQVSNDRLAEKALR